MPPRYQTRSVTREADAPLIIQISPTFDFAQRIRLAAAQDGGIHCGHDALESERRTSPNPICTVHDAVRHTSAAVVNAAEDGKVNAFSTHSFSPPRELDRAGRRKKHQAQKQQKRRAAEASLAAAKSVVRPKVAKKYREPAIVRAKQFAACSLPHSKPAWTGMSTSIIESKIWTLQELLALDFRLVEWDGKKHMVAAGQDDIPVVRFIGPPEDPKTPMPSSSWMDCMGRVYEAFADFACSNRLHGPTSRSRGQYPAILAGVSLGGGGQSPHAIAGSGFANPLLRNKDVQRLAHFQSNVFASAIPRLWAKYKDTMDQIYEKLPQLVRNFPRSVFAAAAFNLGPRVVCKGHIDGRNLSYGQCAITALGDYDYTKGGHIYLWELGLVVQFPPGSTTFIPSATITHGNTPIQPGEKRASFTQYCAGPLFQWLSFDFRTGVEWKQSDPKAKAKSDAQGGQRWLDGLNLYDKVCRQV